MTKLKLRRRPRHQRGSLWLRKDRAEFWVRFYTADAGTGERRQTAKFLCAKDDVHYSKTCRSVVELREQFMRERQPSTDPAGELRDQRVVDFWDAVYLPYSRGRHRPSSVKGALKLWHGTLRDHFAGRTLATYQTHEGSKLLTALALRGLSRNSIAHVRSLASGIFTHAINLGILEHNPWHEVKILAKVKESAPTQHYTLEEAEDCISA